MFRWYKELLEIRQEARERRIALLKEQNQCESCEVLKQQLEMANFEREKLLNRILEKPAQEPKSELREVTRPTSVPWRVRQQMLEAEDREKARLMREAPKPVSTEDLERELKVAETIRETEGQH